MIGFSIRFPTFSVVQGCRRRWLARRFGSDGAPRPDDARTESEPTAAAEQPHSHLSFAGSWPPALEPGLRGRMATELRVLPAFVSEQEERQLMAELEPALKRMRYEYDHWDDAIHGYKETERGEWRPENEAVMARVRAVAFPPVVGVGTQDRAADPGPPQSHCHVLDLAPAGHIKPHIDAVRYCGAVIAGLCLLSDAVMRLQHSTRPELRVDALLPRRGLYIMTGSARYCFTHAVLSNEESEWDGERVVKRRRVAVIARSVPTGEGDGNTDPVFYSYTTRGQGRTDDR